jgi:hypothetical protein
MPEQGESGEPLFRAHPRLLFSAEKLEAKTSALYGDKFFFLKEEVDFMSLTQQRRNQGRTRNLVPRLECLEDRWCPSGASISIAQGVITIHGDGKADTIAVSDNGQGTVNATITSASGQVLSQGGGQSLSTIKIDGEGGNVTVNYLLTGTLMTPETLDLCLGGGNVNATLDYSAGLASSLSLNVNGAGSGTNTLSTVVGNMSATAMFNQMECLDTGATKATTTFKGTETAGASISIAAGGVGGANELVTNFGNVTGAMVNLHEELGAGTASSAVTFGNLSGANVSIDIDGGAGTHQITSSFGAIGSNSNVDDEACLGTGTDSYTVTLNGGISGNSHVDFDPATASSNATIKVNALTTDIAAGSSLEFCLGDTSGQKSMSINYSGKVDGYLSVQSHTGTSQASLIDNITINQGSLGTVFAREFGGTAADSLTLNVYDNSGGKGNPSTLSSLDAAILAYGSDTVTHTSNVRVIAEK